MSTGTLVAGPLPKIGRTELAQIPVPEATSTHKPIPHHVIVEGLVETLSFRHIGVVNEEFAVSADGMKMFGVLDLETQMEGCRFAIGIRNSHDKSIRLGLTAGLRVFVCSNMAFSGDFAPVLAKHSKAFSLIDDLGWRRSDTSQLRIHEGSGVGLAPSEGPRSHKRRLSLRSLGECDSGMAQAIGTLGCDLDGLGRGRQRQCY
jgi:hypothetical protein